jgi:carbon-monoxide dehydrogenase medium subunit
VKPGRFEYKAPRTIDEALADLDEHKDEAKILAGGQSLVPAMNFRLAQPAVIIDINRVAGLGSLGTSGGQLSIGALVRHAELEALVVDDPLAHLLGRVSRFVGHYPIRIRGTFAGSLAHADPAAEWCALALALDAVIVARDARGTRDIGAQEFFDAPFTTALRADEMIVEVRLPLLGPKTGTGFVEHSHTAGDFATVAVVATADVVDGNITSARVALAGVEGRPIRGDAAERALSGAPATSDSAAAAAAAISEAVEPTNDVHASADYRRHLSRVLTETAVNQALRDAA